MLSSKERPEKRTRFAIYARYSSEMQNELSLEAQEARCRDAIAERGGVVVSSSKTAPRRAGALSAMALSRCAVLPNMDVSTPSCSGSSTGWHATTTIPS